MGDRDALRGGNTYEDHVVAYRAARMLVDALADVEGVRELRREDKRFPGFDDVSETSHRDGRPWIKSWQIKSGALDAKQLTAVLRQAWTAACDEATLGFREWFEVDGHELRHLGALCRGTRASIVDAEQLWSASSKLDRAWLDWITTELAMSRGEAVALLGRLSVERLGNLDEVDDLARDFLARQLPPTDVASVHNALIDVVSRLRKTDVVTPGALARLLERSGSSFAPLGGEGGTRAKYLSSVASRWRAHQPLDSLHGAGTWKSSVRSASVFVPAHVTDEARRHLAQPKRNDRGRTPDGSDDDLEIEAVLSRISRERCVALVGDVGTGKSTLLAWCAHHLGERAVRDVAAPMPLLVHARELQRCGWPEVLSSVSASLRLADYSASWALLVDGVDEIGSSVWQQLDVIRGEELRLAPGRRGPRLAGIVAATRPSTLPGGADGFATLLISPWTAADVRRYLASWRVLGEECRAAVTRVLESLGSEDHDLLRVPLTATAAILIALNRRVVPRHRAALFAQTVHLMFDAWRARRDEPRVSFDAVRTMLSELAREALSGPISLERFERACIANGIEVADAIHDEVERHLGVLVREGNAASFALRSVAEFLYAYDLRGKPSEVVLAAARGYAGMEPVRHVIGLDAAEGRMQLANERIAGLLQGTETATVDTSTLRQVVTAVYSAADIEQADSNSLNSSTVDAVVAAVADGLLDEESVWVGELMIEPTRRIARAAGAVWAGLRTALRPRFALAADPVHWFIERELGLDVLAQALWHRDAPVRAVAIDAMARYSAKEEVCELLALMIGDDSHDYFGGAPPAVCAGLALRSMPRGPAAGPTLEWLASIARLTGQLMPGAAALALHPGECEAHVLVKALKWLSDAYKPIQQVVEAIARTDEGRDALAAEWPDWRARVSDSEQHNRYQALASDAVLPPSGEVRARVVRAIGPRLPEMEPDELGCFTAGAHSEYLAELIRAGRIDKLLTVDLGNAALGVEKEFGELVAESEVLATHLLDAWATWDRTQQFPGAALERLIGRGSAAAATVYSEWLPTSLYATGMKMSTPLHAALQHETVRPVAIEIAYNAVQRCVEPDADGKRVFAPSGGNVVSLLRGAFHESGELVRLAWRLLHADQRSGLRGLLLAVDDVVLPDERIAELVTIFEGRLGEAVDETGRVAVERYFDIELDLGWVDRRELAPHLDGALQRLSSVDSVLGWHAIAVRWKALTIIEREIASKRIAQASIHEIAETLPPRYLARLVAVAPDAWCASLQDALDRGARLEGSVAAEVFALLPRLQQRTVAGRLATSDLAQLELPWHRRGGSRLDCARPADILRKTLYELGL